MIRTQISLTETQHQWLKDRAREEDVSMSEMVRRAVDRLRNDRQSGKVAALSLLGAFVADRDDVSTNHDDYLYGPRGEEDDE